MMDDMTYQKFANTVLLAGVSLYAFSSPEEEYSMYRDHDPFECLDGRRLFGDKKKRREATDVDPKDWFLTIKWKCGGQSGGSCWGGENYSVSGDTEPEFVDLDAVLEAVCPQITLLEYKKLMRSLDIKEYEYRDSEYYGNYSDYRIKVISVRNLYDQLLSL